MRASPAETIGFGNDLAAEEAVRPKPVLRLVPHVVEVEDLTAVSDEAPYLPVDDDPAIQEALATVDEDIVEDRTAEEPDAKTDGLDDKIQDGTSVNSIEIDDNLPIRFFRRRGGRGYRGGCAACKASTTESSPEGNSSRAGCSSCQSKPGGQAMPGTLAA